MELLDRISTDPNVMVGKPVIKGTRIPVETILAHLSVTPDVQDLLEAYPRLTVEDVKACFAYAEEQIRKSYKRSRKGQLTSTSIKMK